MQRVDRLVRRHHLLRQGRPFFSVVRLVYYWQFDLIIYFYKRNYLMDADYDIFEIVAVIRDFWLVDAESYQRSYCATNGQPLAPGYYVVSWPEHVRARRFNEHALYHRLFKTRKEAQTAQDILHKEWKRVLTMASGISSVVAPNSSRVEVEKIALQKLRQAEGPKVRQTGYVPKPRISGFPSSEYWKTVKIAVQ